MQQYRLELVDEDGSALNNDTALDMYVEQAYSGEIVYDDALETIYRITLVRAPDCML